MIRAFARALLITVILLLLMAGFSAYIYPISSGWRTIFLIGIGIIQAWLTIMFFLDPPEDWD